MAKTFISVGMLTRNRPALFHKCLASLMESADMPFDLFILDNGSVCDQENTGIILDTPRSTWLRQYEPTYKGRNYGVALGRNYLLSRMTTPFKVIVDDDLLFPKGWMTECLGIHNLIENVGVVGVAPENLTQHRWQVTENGCTFWETQGNVGGCCMLIPPKTWELLGYFMSELWPYGAEDGDYGARTRMLGLRNLYIDTPCIHMQGESWAEDQWKRVQHDFNAGLRLQFHEDIRAGVRPIRCDFDPNKLDQYYDEAVALRKANGIPVDE